MNTTMQPNITPKIINTNAALSTYSCDALIVGLFTSTAKSKHIAAPANSLALIEALNLSGASKLDLPTELGKTHTVYPSADSGVKAARVVCVGLGEANKFNAKRYVKALRAALIDCSNTQVKTVVHGFMDATIIKTSAVGIDVDVNVNVDVRFKAHQALILAHEACYRYDATLTKKASARALTSVILPVGNAADFKLAALGAKQGAAIGQGANTTRELANLPANICTPKYLAKQAQALAKQFGMACEVLERKQLQALKMGSFLSVAAGSDEPPRLIVLKYNGGKKGDKNTQSPHVLVGKGVTFDTGGISLKPGLNMDEMKYDMCGAASVLGTMHAVAQLGLAINVVAVIPATENMPNGRATKPGDVITSMSGQTIEVLNTDAEGRLILCDALTYAQRFKPAAVIDVATLTGACVVALGAVNSGLYGNNDNLVSQLQAASQASLDGAWHMPMSEEYHEQLKSNFADIANIGGPPAGSVTAACFLSKFTQAYPWAHLDIAGTAWKSGAAKGATGRPVALLTQYLIDNAK